MGRLLLLAALCMALALAFPAPVLAQSASASAAPEDYGAVTARGAGTVPLDPDGTCPGGYVTVNAPLCAEGSPNAPGRIFGEGDLASASASASVSAWADPCPDSGFPRETPDGCQASDLPDVEFGSASASATARRQPRRSGRDRGVAFRRHGSRWAAPASSATRAPAESSFSGL